MALWGARNPGVCRMLSAMSRVWAIVFVAGLIAAACNPSDAAPIAATVATPTTLAKVTTLAPVTSTTTPASETTTATVPIPENECTVAPSSAVEGYAHGCTVLGIEVLAAEEVDAEAIVQVADRTYNMLIFRPEYAPAIAAFPIGIRVMASNQRIMDLREFDEIYFHHPGFDWSYLGRSFAGTEDIPFAAGAEENLLCSEEDRYEGEDVFIREFAITIRRFAMEVVDPSTSEAIEQAYAVAIAEGKWKNTLAEINSEQYWAEGAQSYFDANLEDNAEEREPISSHNHVDTRDELRAYDRALFEIAASVFGDSDERPNCST
jgi:hypothetical protein